MIGFLVQEAGFHPLFATASRNIGPAIRHLDEVRAAAPVFFEVLAVTIGALELRRALTGWEIGTGQNLKDDYYPGDIGASFVNVVVGASDLFAVRRSYRSHSRLPMPRNSLFLHLLYANMHSSSYIQQINAGFDPLGLKPTTAGDFEAMATKELNNGRLAMLGVAGFIVQELVNGKAIFVNLGLAADNFDPSTLPVQF